jgi:hypothetical protein
VSSAAQAYILKPEVGVQHDDNFINHNVRHAGVSGDSVIISLIIDFEKPKIRSEMDSAEQKCEDAGLN